ncbi:hypothetical protein ACWERV_17120 [Streptomyces sp. NPDC004031]
MSVAGDDAREEARTALYKAITRNLKDAEELSSVRDRVTLLEDLAGAYADITFPKR